MIKTCPWCKQQFRPPSKQGNARTYCSRDCYLQSKARQIKKICPTCSKEFSVIQARQNAKHCSKKCQAQKVQLTCAYCGETFYEKRSHAHLRQTCSRRCLALLKHKEGRTPNQGKIKSDAERQKISDDLKRYFQANPTKHPWYKDGSHSNGKQRRGPDWNEQRRIARTRDNYTCCICGKTETEIGKQLSVHHIISYRRFASSQEANVLENLICTCQSCHMKLEHTLIDISQIISPR